MATNFVDNEKVVRVIESAIDARNQSANSQIEDIKDTISHSTWLSMLAIGIIAAATTMSSHQTFVYTYIASALSIFLSGISIYFSAKQNALSNNLLNKYRQLLLGYSAVRTELLAGNHSPSDLDRFAQEIYNDVLTSNEYKTDITGVSEKIKSCGDPDRHANSQVKCLLLSVVAFVFQGMLFVVGQAFQTISS